MSEIGEAPIELMPWQQGIVDAVIAGESLGVGHLPRGYGKAIVQREVERVARVLGHHIHLLHPDGLTCTATPPCDPYAKPPPPGGAS